MKTFKTEAQPRLLIVFFTVIVFFTIVAYLTEGHIS